MLETLRLAGLVEVVDEARTLEDVPGYRLPASGILWREGDGSKPFRDPIRVPGESEAGGRTNPFFVNFYRSLASELAGFEAREHTAQVPYEDRLIREDRFRKGELPILYCSPTKEVGVSIRPHRSKDGHSRHFVNDVLKISAVFHCFSAVFHCFAIGLWFATEVRAQSGINSKVERRLRDADAAANR